MKLRGVLTRAGVALMVLATTMAMAAAGDAAVSDTEGQTTLSQRVVPATSGSYRFLKLGEGEPYTVSEELASANPERTEERTSLTYSASSPTSSLPTRSHRPGWRSSTRRHGPKRPRVGRQDDELQRPAVRRARRRRRSQDRNVELLVEDPR